MEEIHIEQAQAQQDNELQSQQSQTFHISASEVLRDYRLAHESRYASLIGRREVLNGKAKFGIFGDGKELAQIAMAKAFQKGDFRSGYYRDQTFMLAIGALTMEQFFAGLYANTDVHEDPHSAGRQMNCHFATRSLDKDGRFRDLTQMMNSSADIAPTGGQMPRLVGLGYASRLYRELAELQQFTRFSQNGREVAFGTIGNASAAEGLFWESINAIGVLKAPVIMSIWDDDYGISVTNEHQHTKENLSELLRGFQRNTDQEAGFEIYTVKGWDYVQLVETYLKAARDARERHIPAIIHVTEMTQPQGHSTSGSHERYKPKSRLAWEDAFDCLPKMREWIIAEGIAPAAELDNIERNARKFAENKRNKGWIAFSRPIYDERQQAAKLIQAVETHSPQAAEIANLRRQMVKKLAPYRKDILSTVYKVLLLSGRDGGTAVANLVQWKNRFETENKRRFGSHLTSESAAAATKVPEIPPVFAANPPQLKGYEILNQAFDAIFARDPRVITFGEDVGFLGGVNQTMAGMQEKYGPLRVSDTGIREATIVGQAIGLAMRGLRPIAEIQYLDYLLYAIQIMSDDLATLHWRTKGGQKAPVVVRTRGHRLEGIWHAGSPMAAIIHLLRGMHVAVPRDMVQAAGFYNTFIQSDEPALVIEVLNGYRRRENVPENLAEFTVPLGIPEIVRTGEDFTIVTYGAMVHIVLTAAEMLAQMGIDVEVIDVRTLLPFDTQGIILESLQKTSRILFADEDMPGGTTAYMMQEVLEKQGGFHWLDAEPRTLTAQPHRPAYGSDGGYFSKPNAEQVFTAVYEQMNEADPANFPIFYR